MIDAATGQSAREAEVRIAQVLDGPSRADHAAIRSAAMAVFALRDAAIRGHRAGRVDRASLDCANALASLAYGAEFPLSGLHLGRLSQTREGLQALLAQR